MSGSNLTSLVIVLAAVVAAPILADRVARWFIVPTVVIEILIGVVIGPGLGLVHPSSELDFLSALGLATLLFLAGLEVDLPGLRGAPLRKAGIGWLISLAAGIVVGLVLSPIDGPRSGLIVGLVLTTTALGALLPILRDSGLLETPFGRHTLAGAATGELGPIIAVALLLSSDRPWHTALILIAFIAVVGLAAVLAMRDRNRGLARLLETTLNTSGQFAIRTIVFFLCFMVWVASELGLDVLLGAFAAGMVFRLFAAGASEREAELVDAKLQGLGFGFLIPVFFVTSGVQFDLDAIRHQPLLLLAAVGFLVLALLVRGLPTVALHGEMAIRDRLALGCYVATTLPLVVVITTIGTTTGRLRSGIAAALVTSAMLSMLLLPVVADRLRRQTCADQPIDALAARSAST